MSQPLKSPFQKDLAKVSGREKTRYKRRKVHTIEKALELALYARMVEHRLYTPTLREVSLPFEEPDIQKMAA